MSYKKSGWINPLGHGAYARSDDGDLDWTGAVYSLQNQYEYDLHPGSRTTFELKGMSHYLRMGKSTVFLLTPDKQKNFLPSWLHVFEKRGVQFKLTQISIFENGFTDLEDFQPPHSTFTIQISSFEQALLEMLSLTNRQVDLDEAYKIFEMVRAIDAAKMSTLLRKCTSVKAKRLFMVMATRHQMPWLNDINLEGVDFGTGSRSVAAGGHFDRDYSLIVPSEWYEDVLPKI